MRFCLLAAVLFGCVAGCSSEPPEPTVIKAQDDRTPPGKGQARGR